VILNGIDKFVSQGDLADRAIFLSLRPIVPSSRRCEDECWKAFDADHPRILGALLDAVVGGLRELPTVRPKLLPRMADFAKFAEAVGQALGWSAGRALADYDANRRDAAMTKLDGSPLAAFLLDLGPDYLLDWSGPPSELLYELTALAGEKAESDGWPKSPQWLTIELRRLAPQLSVHGIFVHSSRNSRGRVLSVRRDRKMYED
jgi:hypothetical protein